MVPHFNKSIFVLTTAALLLAGVSYGQGGIDPQAIWPEARNIGDDRRVSSWFGSFNISRVPWIRHDELDWLKVADGSTQFNLYLFDPALVWLWTNREIYPILYSFNRAAWLSYAEGTSNPRFFYDFALEDWITLFAQDDNSGPVLNGFNIFNTSLLLNEVLVGGVPRDGIPSIDNPHFVSVSEAIASFMEDDDVLTSVTIDGETHAYPFRVLNWHEIVNDNIGDTYYAATYCPLCGTAMVFDRMVNGRLLEFGVSGLLFQDNLLMYDRETESLWQQFTLKSVAGPQLGTKLRFMLSEQLTFKAWREKYPEGQVLSTNTGFFRNYFINPYAAYENSPGALFFRGNIRDDLRGKDFVWGLIIDDVAKAYPRDQLPSGATFEDVVNSKTLSITYNADTGLIQAIDKATGIELTGVWSFWFV